MTNAYGKMIDKTYLSCDNAEDRGFIHRDYIAHCLRWTHVVKYLSDKARYKTHYVLDIGCGKEAPLIKTLYSSRLLPKLYVGVDVGKISPKINFAGKDTVHFIENTNFLELEIPDYSFDTIVMFEVLEHVERNMGIDIIERVQEFMTVESTFFLSTPCFNGAAANNHVHEWTYHELKEVLLNYFDIVEHWGTFASIKDYQHMLTSEMRDLFNRLRDYYDVNYLATIFAPLFPEYARNVLWKLRLI